MMPDLKPKKWAGAIRTVTLGAGSRRPLTVGGGNGLPLHTFEGEFPHRPLLALEINGADAAGADLVMVRVNGSPEEAAAEVRAVLDRVDVPLIVKGPGAGPKQNEVLARVAEEFSGEGLVLHSACQEDYKTLAAVAVAYGHVLAAESPIDMNLAKQLNILLADASMDLNRVLIDPFTGGLGYGLEYTYSVMERIRLAALGGDAMLNSPMICLVGPEAWKAKEARVSGVNWEVATALPLIEAGAEVVVLRHPESLARLRGQLDSWFGGDACR
ncbi:MAG: acetyl-CoA decarbonylase/synthase complex subunit delta [Acidobacteria bacterium]|nr:acetyl-CoA decarbonylase/synthase complex subunit delta [Acidobacteriota bacterium]